MLPVILEPNQPPRGYLGGTGIAAFRGIPDPGPGFPEDFVASVTEVFTGGGFGLSRLPQGNGGGLLRDAIAADPVSWLGQSHLDRFGTSTELLVKLLDTGQRLFVHFHPDDEFASRHLTLAHGKTEAWIITHIRELPGLDSACAWLGFTSAVSASQVERWVDEQDTDALLGALNRVPLRVGSSILVPAGTPHAIAAGITLVELQQPTDLSIMLEASSDPTDDRSNDYLGLDRETALSALDLDAMSPDRIAELTSTRGGTDGVTPLFPAEADSFFRAERIEVSDSTLVPAGFSVLVILDGDGVLDSGEGSLAVSRGMTVLTPYSAGQLTLTGTLAALRCRPPT